MGSHLPAYATAPGRALLAFQGEAYRNAYLAQTELRPLTAHTLSQPKALQAELHAIAQLGHAWVAGEYDLQVSGLAVPIHDEQRQVVVALSANLLSKEFDRERAEHEVLPALHSAAQQLSGLAPSFLAPVL